MRHVELIIWKIQVLGIWFLLRSTKKGHKSIFNKKIYQKNYKLEFVSCLVFNY